MIVPAGTDCEAGAGLATLEGEGSMVLEDTILTECPRDAEFVELLEGRHPEPDAERLGAAPRGVPRRRALVDGLTTGETARWRAVLGPRPSAAGATIGRYLRPVKLIGQGRHGRGPRGLRSRRAGSARAPSSPCAPPGAPRAPEPASRSAEARALGKLSHPNVVQVYDVGEHEGDVFVAMELVEGQAFDAWCRSAPAPGWQAVLAAYLDAARGLSAAHDKGLVHRDVKPSNILRGVDGRVRASATSGPPPAGAGLRKMRTPSPSSRRASPARRSHAGASGERLTATGAILGTPLYMAPEQFDGLRASPASDQYSLCTALYEGLYGALPFGGVEGRTPATRLAPRSWRGRETARPPRPPARPCPRGSGGLSRAASPPGQRTGTPRSRR